MVDNALEELMEEAEGLVRRIEKAKIEEAKVRGKIEEAKEAMVERFGVEKTKDAKKKLEEIEEEMDKVGEEMRALREGIKDKYGI